MHKNSILTHSVTLTIAAVIGAAGLIIFLYFMIKVVSLILLFSLPSDSQKHLTTYTDNTGTTYNIAREQSWVKAEQCFYVITRDKKFYPFDEWIGHQFYSCHEEEENKFVGGRPSEGTAFGPFRFEYNHITHESKILPLLK